MRIALLTYRGNPYSGGQGVYVRHLSRALRDAGHHVTVLSGPAYPDLDPGVRLVRVPSLDLYSAIEGGVPAWKRIRGPADGVEYALGRTGVFSEPLAFGLRALAWLARHRDFDVVHDNQSLSYPLLAIPRVAAPAIATIHHPIHVDLKFALQGAETRSSRREIRRWYRFLRMQGAVARRLPAVITVSDQARLDTARHFRIDPAKVHRVYNGVDTERFAAHEDVRRVLNRIVVVNSADQEIKGLRYLYPTIERIAAKRDVEVLVVGSPRNPALVGEELRRRGIADRVRFLGKLPEDQLARVYCSASVAVVPSRYEGFGLPAAEALASSVPVVAFAAGALPEVLGADGMTGRIVPLGDTDAMAEAVIELLDDPVRSLRLGAAGRQRVLERFSWDRAAEETVRVYREATTC